MCNEKYFPKIFILLFLFQFFFACKSNDVEDSNIAPVPYLIEEELNFKDKPEPVKYIFLRLYNPNYSDPFYIANLLKTGINITDCTRFELSHASINFSLNDDFYGLTLNGIYNFERESCTDIYNNEYMIRCNPATSEQITFAIKVSEEEYENTKKMVEDYYAFGDIKYHTTDNFLMALFLTKRKYFTRKKKQSLEELNYPRSFLREKKREDPKYIENDFVCSTFIAYILSNNVKEIRSWFIEHDVNYNYISVTDLPYIPGVVPLFYSTWDNYLYASKLFIEQHPEFEEYLGK